MSETIPYGRLCNQIIRNLAVSFNAEKFDLFVNYSSHDLIKKLGIPLFVGKNKYKETIDLIDNNYFFILNNDKLEKNIASNNAFFQTKEITNLIHSYLHKDDIKNSIINNNPFKERYNNNNDLCIHIRLTDATNFNPGINYYLNTIKKINYDKLFIATDEINHSMIKEIKEKITDAIILDYDPVNTLQFSSTCKNVILSHGSFSAVIGYLSFFSTVYYPRYHIMWHGDMFSEKGWIEVPI